MDSEHHHRAAQTHDEAAQRHRDAAEHFERRGDVELAAFERRNAEIEMLAGNLERDRAAMADKRAE